MTIITSRPSATSFEAIALPTIPVPSTPIFIIHLRVSPRSHRFLTGTEGESGAHRLDAQPHQEQQIIAGQELLHGCGHRIRKRVALQTIALNRGPKHVHEALDVVRLPLENVESGDRLAMSHEEGRVGGEFALCAFEIGTTSDRKPSARKACMYVHQIADECL